MKVLSCQGWLSYLVFECRVVHVIGLLIGFIYYYVDHSGHLSPNSTSPLFRRKNNILIKISYQFPFALLFSPPCLRISGQAGQDGDGKCTITSLGIQFIHQRIFSNNDFLCWILSFIFCDYRKLMLLSNKKPFALTAKRDPWRFIIFSDTMDGYYFYIQTENWNRQTTRWVQDSY